MFCTLHWDQLSCAAQIIPVTLWSSHLHVLYNTGRNPGYAKQCAQSYPWTQTWNSSPGSLWFNVSVCVTTGTTTLAILNFGRSHLGLCSNSSILSHLWYIYLIPHPYQSALMKISQGSEGKACGSVGGTIVCIYGWRQSPQLIHWGPARAKAEQMKTHRVPKTAYSNPLPCHATQAGQGTPVSISLTVRSSRSISIARKPAKPLRSDISASQKVISAHHLEWPVVIQWQS